MRWSSRCGTTKSVLMFPFLVSFDALIVQAVVWPVCERLKWPGPSYIRGASHMCDSEMHINITPLICLRCHREKIAREPRTTICHVLNLGVYNAASDIIFTKLISGNCLLEMSLIYFPFQG